MSLKRVRQIIPEFAAPLLIYEAMSLEIHSELRFKILKDFFLGSSPGFSSATPFRTFFGNFWLQFFYQILCILTTPSRFPFCHYFCN